MGANRIYWTTAIAVAFEVFCHNSDCGRDDPIPAKDGSFMWDRLPKEVTCPDCKRTYRVTSRPTT